MSDEDSNYSSPSNESLSHRSKRPKSKFEEFFEIIHASQTAFCKLCQHKKIEIKMKNRNTSGLRKHLISFHKKESEIFLPVKPKLSGDITSFLVTAGRSGQNSVQSINYTDAEETDEHNINDYEIKEDPLEEEETLIPCNRVVPEPDHLNNEINQPVNCNTSARVENEFEIFGKSVASQLSNMPLRAALQGQMFIQSYLSTLRLQQLDNNI